MRAGYLTFALAALGLLLVGTLAGSSAPPATTVSAVLGLDERDPVELDARRAMAVARRTATCMRSLGFLYDPIPEPGVAIPDAGLDPIAWAERWGFGVTTAVDHAPSDAVPDVNAARAERLRADERDRYDRALHGDGTDPGCHGTATTAVYGMRDRALEPLRRQLVELDRLIDADPGMDQAGRDWATCAGASIAPLGSSIVVSGREHLPGALLGWFATRLRAVHSRHDLASAQLLERGTAVAVARCDADFVAARATTAIPHERAFLRMHGQMLARIGVEIRQAEDALPTLPPRDVVAER